MIRYAISSPQTLRFDDRLSSDLEHFASRADWLLYRDKANPDYARNARRLAEEISSDGSLKLLLHDDWSLARELGAFGVHLSARGAQELPRAKESGLYTVVSTHSIDEARRRGREGADAVTLSPIFETPGKGPALGIDYLEQALQELEVPVIALGGIIDAEHVEAVRRCGVFAFASIRYFAPRR